MGLDISLLETFALVADLKSFSQAAKKLGLSQPAVSFQVKSLEKELSASLFDRSGGKVVLTPAGRSAYRHAQKVLSDWKAMQADVPRLSGKVAGHLFIGAGTIPGEYLLPPIVREFKSAYPDVVVSLEVSDSGEVIEKLRLEQVELGYVGARTTDPSMEQKRFASDRLVLVAPPGHVFCSGKRVSLREAVEEEFVNRQPSSGTRQRFEAALDENGIDPGCLKVVAEMGSTQSVLSAVQAGSGVSVVSYEAARAPAGAGLVCMTEISDVDLSRDFFAVKSRERPMSVGAQKFYDFCLAGGTAR